MTLTLFDRLGELPFYNEDLDTDDVGDPVKELRRHAERADAVLVVTPEYNASIPGVLKNAIDWLSRPYGKGALNGKPLAVIGASLGSYGGTWAHDETRKSFTIAGLSHKIDRRRPRYVRGSLGSKTLRVGRAIAWVERRTRQSPANHRARWPLVRSPATSRDSSR